MKIVGISGSMSPESTTRQAMEIILNAAESAGADTKLIHLAEWPLPMFDCREDRDTYPEIVSQFIQEVDGADALVLGSPQYHGSVTGAIKNALDFLNGRHLKGKPVAIFGTAASKLGATDTVNALQVIMRNLHAFPLPSSPSIPVAYEAFDEDGRLKDAGLQERLEKEGKDLVWFTSSLKS
ncbi:NADPH-dependent FMN reductase [Brevibacillus daliensis]|uniref:NADPH-dependent FMN reductase n=1 Tax=Brevibacillus daliensis TaxID=2892995 RepID=UPI001E622056|nr:NAD(P)H-dependent oxidoreductase [Brevibacillus daliensis]